MGFDLKRSQPAHLEMLSSPAGYRRRIVVLLTPLNILEKSRFCEGERGLAHNEMIVHVDVHARECL
jgi:hypothetical protein